MDNADKISMCVDRMRLIKGVNYGIITDKQVQELFKVFDFDETQKQKAYELMKQNNIVTTDESQIPEKLQPAPTKPRELSEQELQEYYQKRFEAAYEGFRLATENKPQLLEKYEAELPIFIKAVATSRELRIYDRIEDALCAVSRSRIKDGQIGGMCSVGANAARRTLMMYMKHFFSRKSLAEIIAACSQGKELDSHQKDMVSMLLHNAPNTQGLVRRKKLSDYLDD